MVKNYYPEDYADKYKAFCDKYHTFENGNSAKRTVRLLSAKGIK
jgi:CDP-glycerol glycerophosphotransferase